MQFEKQDARQEFTATTVQISTIYDFIKSDFIEGKDFGNIPGYAKPTLFKAGAEKLCHFLKLAILYTVEHRHEDWEKGVFHFEVHVQLQDIGNSFIAAEGVGSCNTKEPQYAVLDAFSIANTVLKIAKKRAMIDAVLNVSVTSNFFTQDIEELPTPVEKPCRDASSVTKWQLKRIHQLVQDLNISAEVAKEFIKIVFQVDHSSRLSKVQASRFIQDLLLLKEDEGR